MHNHPPFENWQAVLDAPRSEFFSGHTSDTYLDSQFNPYLSPSTEANFTQSNARVLLGQAANGSLRFLALPTQVYPAPTSTGEFGLGPGLYWFPTDPAVFDGTAYFSRLGGCVTRAEMAESLQAIFDRYVDRATGSLFWWPHGDEFRRELNVPLSVEPLEK